MHVVMSSFGQAEKANEAIENLNKEGFTKEEIGVLMRGYLVQEQAQREAADEALTGAGYGALAGTAAGGLFGLLVGAASISVPVVGPILAGGIVATTLGGAATGAVYGTLLGLVVKLGLADEDVQFYTDAVANDGIVVLVEARGERAAKAWRILHEANATKTQSTIVGQPQNTAIAMPIVGLFPDSKDADRAMKQLLAEDIAKEKLHLVDGFKLEEAQNRNGRGFAISPQPGIYPTPYFVSMDKPALDLAEAHLTELGIDEADVPFYIDAVQQGGTLLIVDTNDKEEAIISRNIMKQLDVTQMATTS